ncbi:phospholipid/cholesterol/gamma-HCH transport system substrate-binding protein [Mucilaginibacter pineti]|uniref:Phospholipid/cholesterol/gamma-HCH transport system substrate-binding protein n=1 Tax=Mucilaginibacter pineti TaxID=1391627 RepID=A0A1G7LKE1_9SPHI|nr:MlaD family protein [Mucilaginibacter pineti]SDF49978.1 phospholipid/cholesterol/gamma-HCH transport system substrate-binding protein [Mucilaginibacter pineti]
MANQGENNTKLGIFVMAGLFVLILTFFMIGKNKSLFGGDFVLKARFSNLNGLMEGNNVLYAGIQAGTVKNIALINDTTIEVTLAINSKVKAYIHKNALVAIGTEGLMGNKVVNIIQVKGTAVNVANGDLLSPQKTVSTEEMLQTLSKTNNNLAVISEGLKGTITRINSSTLMEVIDNKEMGENLKASLRNINKATEDASHITYGLNTLVTGIKQGKGSLGLLLTDTAFAGNLRQAGMKIRSASEQTSALTKQLNEVVDGVHQDLAYGKGPLQVLLRDSAAGSNLNKTIENLQKGTDGFNQNMEALKHNFLFKGYFKKADKKKAQLH